MIVETSLLIGFRSLKKICFYTFLPCLSSFSMFIHFFYYWGYCWPYHISIINLWKFIKWSKLSLHVDIFMGPFIPILVLNEHSEIEMKIYVKCFACDRLLFLLKLWWIENQFFVIGKKYYDLSYFGNWKS